MVKATKAGCDLQRLEREESWKWGECGSFGAMVTTRVPGPLVHRRPELTVVPQRASHGEMLGSIDEKCSTADSLEPGCEPSSVTSVQISWPHPSSGPGHPDSWRVGRQLPGGPLGDRRVTVHSCCCTERSDRRRMRAALWFHCPHCSQEMLSWQQRPERRRGCSSGDEGSA